MREKLITQILHKFHAKRPHNPIFQIKYMFEDVIHVQMQGSYHYKKNGDCARYILRCLIFNTISVSLLRIFQQNSHFCDKIAQALIFTGIYDLACLNYDVHHFSLVKLSKYPWIYMNGVPLSPLPLVKSHNDPIKSVSLLGVVPSDTILPLRSLSFFFI